MKLINTIDDFIKPNEGHSSQVYLYWDTCALLSVIQMVTQLDNDYPVHQINYVLDKINSGSVVSLVSNVVGYELDKNKKEVDESLKRNFNKIHNPILKLFNSFARLENDQHVDYLFDGFFPEKIFDLYDGICNRTRRQNMSVSSNVLTDAYNNLISGKKPSSHEKDIKDALVLYDFMFYLHKIQDLGLEKYKVVFFTRNTSDFAEKRDGSYHVHPDINQVIHRPTFKESCEVVFDFHKLDLLIKGFLE